MHLCVRECEACGMSVREDVCGYDVCVEYRSEAHTWCHDGHGRHGRHAGRHGSRKGHGALGAQGGWHAADSGPLMAPRTKVDVGEALA